ncbi:hypothetical protein GETHLI_04670 [Geothrix limicola]|uniref:histidine kinase n=1 Tax=Geothrix limicola TaxID=2927978 RepID=A0ABQ5QAX3_9BACT|nr:PAS domain S-box protein [Geothrix limicola]GLH71965.1 hypothetical protein GETHLI_04670 [Geothrix limicola]
MEANPPIHILLVEDSEGDALLLERHLRAQGLLFDLRRVDTLAALQEALSGSAWDILLTDFNLPGLDGLEVLQVVGERAPYLPCILVSGELGEEAAVESLRRGAKDFISKSRLARLVPAIQREVHEQRIRAAAESTRAELLTLEDRLRAITSATVDGIVVMDGEGRISFWNQAAERLFGYTESEAMGRDLHALIAPSRLQSTSGSGVARLNEIGPCSAAGRVIQLDARRKDGTEFPVEVTLAALRQGDTWHSVGVVRDITERKDQESKQFETLQFLRTLIETIPSPLYYEDMGGRILGCNRAFQAFLGLPAEAVIGHLTADLLAGAEEDQAHETEPGFLRIPDAYDTSFHMPLAGGRTRHALFKKAPFWDAEGRPEGYVATLLDITRLKETEEALRQNEWLFSAIHRHVVDLIAIIDPQGRRIYTSPSYQFVLGYSDEEMERLSSLDLLHPADLDRVSQALRGIMEGQAAQGLEYRLRHKDGRWLYFESKAAIIPDPGTGNVRALVVARDITERKEAEQSRSAMEVQLRQAQKLEAIGQLAAGIAHEINTPTQFIGDNTSFLRDAWKDAFALMERLTGHLGAIAAAFGPGAEEARAALADVEQTDLRYLQEEIPKAIQQSLDGVSRISKIVKAMKDFSHPGGEAKTLTDLHQAIESTITVSRNEWKYAANLVTDFDPDLPRVPCFPGEFNQVILNLIVNAAHAIESALGGAGSGVLGQITIKTRRQGDEVEVMVSDNGTGIPESVQARMFEPFYTTKPVGKGTGQGLAIAHAVIVEKHQGRIEVRSEVGRGTTFILHLPLKAAAAGGGAE